MIATATMPTVAIASAEEPRRECMSLQKDSGSAITSAKAGTTNGREAKKECVPNRRRATGCARSGSAAHTSTLNPGASWKRLMAFSASSEGPAIFAE